MENIGEKHSGAETVGGVGGRRPASQAPSVKGQETRLRSKEGQGPPSNPHAEITECLGIQ